MHPRILVPIFCWHLICLEDSCNPDPATEGEAMATTNGKAGQTDTVPASCQRGNDVWLGRQRCSSIGYAVLPCRLLGLVVAITSVAFLLASASRLMDGGCIGQMPEIVDGNYPHTQRGCDAQAWGVSELLRVWLKLAPKS